MPLSYLLKSFERVLELASEKAVEQSRVLELKTLAEGQLEREREKQQLEEDRYAKAQAAFSLAYPSEDAQKRHSLRSSKPNSSSALETRSLFAALPC